MVGAGLGGVVGRTRPVWGVLGERLLAVEREIPVDLTGGDVVEPRDPASAGGLAKRLGPEHVRPEETGRVQDRQAVVRLGGEVHDRLDPVPGEGLGDQGLVADVPVDENHPAGALQLGDAATVPGICQGVENDELVLRPACGPVAHEVGPDKSPRLL